MICFKNLIVVALIASIGLNLYLIHFSDSPKSHSEQSPTPTPPSSNYRFLSKRIFVEDPNDTIINFVPLRSSLTKYVEDVHKKTSKTKVGLYFEYLPTGNSIGINEKEDYLEASLIKLPTTMAIYKLIELGKFNEQTIFEITTDDLDYQYGEAYKLGAGYKMSISEAISLILTKSDNTVFKLLRHNIPPGFLENVYDYLDIPITVDIDSDPIISPKNYVSILRSLYLSSYNSRDHSEAILDILSQNKNRNWLGLLLPLDATISRKDGTFIQVDSRVPTYSDCGIVYVPKRPYALCIMTSGLLEDEAKKIISTISLKTYQYITSVNLSN